MLDKLVNYPEDNIINVLFKEDTFSEDDIQKLDSTLVALVERSSAIKDTPDVKLLEAIFLKIQQLGLNLKFSQKSFDYIKQFIIESKDKIFNRKIPPEGIINKPIPIELKGTPLFSDEEIIKRSVIKDEKRATSKDKRFFKELLSENGKTVLQQQSKASCVYTCIAMLLKDEKKEPDFHSVFYGNYTLASKGHHLFREHNLKAKDENVKGSNKEKMTQALKDVLSEGSCILGIDGEIGGHAIILDYISEDNKIARIRDPYHGWEIEITMAALLQRTGLSTDATYIVK